MKFDSLCIGDWVEVNQDPDDFKHVTEQFKGRIGQVVWMWQGLCCCDSDGIEISFGDDNNLFLCRFGVFKELRVVQRSLRWQYAS